MQFLAALFVSFVLTGNLRASDSQSVEAVLAQTAAQVNSGELQDAEKTLKEGVRAHGDHPDLLKALGTLYQTQLRFKESIDVFQKILMQAPAYPEVNLQIGVSYYSLNQFDKAVEFLKKELQTNPKDRDAQYNLALALEAAGLNSEAIHELENLLADRPNDAPALYQLALFYKSSMKNTIERLSKLAPDSDFMLALKAEVYADYDRLNEAIREYKRLLDKNPNFPGLHFALGQTYWRMAKTEEAREELRLALLDDPNHATSHFYLADILVKDQRLSEAISHLEASVAANPRFMQAQLLLGKCLATEGKPREALEHLIVALSLEPRNKMTHYQLAQVYSRLSDQANSQKHMSTFETLTREDKEDIEKKLQLDTSKVH